MVRDMLLDLLSDGNDPILQRALTDRSCMNSTHFHVDSLSDTNVDLATLGDALLRFCLVDMFIGAGGELSILKEKYERDCVLVTVIGRHYRILDHLRFNESDRNMPIDYVWNPHGGSARDPIHKHIATAMEALLAAVYYLKGIRYVKSVVRHWVALIDASENGSHTF